MSVNRFGKKPVESVTKPVSVPNDTLRTKVGAIWENKSFKGETWFRIKLTDNGQDIWLKAFNNGYKKSASEPSFIIYREDVAGSVTKEVPTEESAF
jgi:hypothetical protein